MRELWDIQEKLGKRLASKIMAIKESDSAAFESLVALLRENEKCEPKALAHDLIEWVGRTLCPYWSGYHGQYLYTGWNFSGVKEEDRPHYLQRVVEWMIASAWSGENAWGPKDWPGFRTGIDIYESLFFILSKRVDKRFDQFETPAAFLAALQTYRNVNFIYDIADEVCLGENATEVWRAKETVHVDGKDRPAARLIRLDHPYAKYFYRAGCPTLKIYNGGLAPVYFEEQVKRWSAEQGLIIHTADGQRAQFTFGRGGVFRDVSSNEAADLKPYIEKYSPLIEGLEPYILDSLTVAEKDDPQGDRGSFLKEGVYHPRDQYKQLSSVRHFIDCVAERSIHDEAAEKCLIKVLTLLSLKGENYLAYDIIIENIWRLKRLSNDASWSDNRNKFFSIIPSSVLESIIDFSHRNRSRHMNHHLIQMAECYPPFRPLLSEKIITDYLADIKRYDDKGVKDARQKGEAWDYSDYLDVRNALTIAKEDSAWQQAAKKALPANLRAIHGDAKEDALVAIIEAVRQPPYQDDVAFPVYEILSGNIRNQTSARLSRVAETILDSAVDIPAWGRAIVNGDKRVSLYLEKFCSDKWVLLVRKYPPAAGTTPRAAVS